MSQPTSTNSFPSGSQNGEPRVGSAAVPMWLMVLPMILLFCGGFYFDRRGGWFDPAVHEPFTSISQIQMYQPATGGDRALLRGKAVYEQVCALCHSVDGMGKPGQAPPLAGSEWVLDENIGQLIRIPLQGLSGPITVKGESWNLAMPAMGAALADEDLAALLSYMRSAWGNQASMITPEQVKAVRDATKGRTQPWTATELKAVQ